MSVATTCDFTNRGDNSTETETSTSLTTINDGLNTGSFLVLDGSLDITLNQDMMCDGDIQYTDISENFQLQGKSTDRSDTFAVLTPSWYIALEYNINGLIEVCDNNSTDSCDDAFKINATVTFTNSDLGNATLCDYSLPNSSLDNLKLAQFNAFDQSGNTTSWDLLTNLTLSGGDGGTGPAISVDNLAIVNQGQAVDGTFSSLTSTCDEDLNLAQVVYWNDSHTMLNVPDQPERADADVLSAELTTANIVASLDSSLADICDEIEGDTLTAWTLKINQGSFNASNNLSKFAHSADKTTTSVFSDGDKVVLSSPASYTVSITNYDDTKIVLANDYVYGVLVQT